jgi:hypothetical protein
MLQAPFAPSTCRRVLFEPALVPEDDKMHARSAADRIRARLNTLVVLALAASASPAAVAGEQPSVWTGVDRVVAFADVHGAYAEVTSLLRSVGVVDEGLHWTGGRTHLVSLGDLLDRGADSRKVMDLLIRLQGEAATAGGQVHVVLGNHEAMNVLGDLRYVDPGEYAAFAGEEPRDQRETLRADWVARNGAASAAAFDEKFPPGFFGHRAAFAPRGRYGQWLLGLPVAIVVNDTVFMHGGPSKVLTGLSVQEINLRYRAALRDYLATLEVLEAAQLLRPEDPYAERPALAQQRLAALTTADELSLARLKDALQKFTAADRSPMIEPDGPNWYRGAALCNECSEADVLDPFLATVGARRLVIGHTVARDTRVASRFDGRVVKLDAGMNRAAYRGRPAALTLDQGGARVSYADDRAPPAEIPAEPLYVASPALDDARVTEILAKGTVTVGGPRSPGTIDVSVDYEGEKVPAIFSATTRDDARRELAAHRVDRLLQLGLVPATVEREVQGQRGVLQARPDRTVTLADVQRDKLRVGGWCALEPQYELMYGFDALIGNEARTADRILYDGAWMLLLTGHGQSFGTARTLPAHLQARPPSPGPELRRRLESLDDATLAAALGELVTSRERKALLDRRNTLLAPAAAAAR